MTELKKPNLIDKIIRYFSPIRGYQRSKARAFTAISDSYVGASYKRTLSGWSPQQSDADTDIIPGLPRLRSRSRDLIRNAPVATGAINTVVTNVIGTGLKLQSRPNRSILKLTDEQADAWEMQTETEFALWSESQDCDIRRTLTFTGMQDLVFRQVLENGDVLAVVSHVKRPFSPYTLALQIIEADRLCNKGLAPNSATLVEGVQRDETGAPIAYHICNQHPWGSWITPVALTWTIVQAFGPKTDLRNVIHLYRTLRPGQTRGVPYLSPVIETLKQLTRYTDAEIMAAVVAGFFTVFIKSDIGMGGIPITSMSETGAAGTTTSDEELKLGNGALVGLRPGESIETANPQRPNTSFDPFVKAILEQVGVALEIPFEILIGHFSASYSASRAALLEAWRFFRGRRAWLSKNFCQTVYENFLYEAVASERLSAPGFFTDPLIRKAYSGALWIGEAPSQIDPLKEVDAAEKRLKLLLSTIDEETVMITGGDFESNYPRIKKEREMAKAIGMEFEKKAPSPFGGSFDQGVTE